MEAKPMKAMNQILKNKKFRAWCVFSIVLACMCSMPALAANDPLAVINNLSTFMFSVIHAIGLIRLSLKGHDPSQRANGFMTLAGGVIIMFSKEILDLIVK